MVVIKKAIVKAYILLESLVTLSIFALITSLLLSTINQARQAEQQSFQEQEVLNVAKMAIQTNQNQLSLNGVRVEVVSEAQHIRIFHEGQEVLHVEKQ
ncbi:competence type IV pilus minor pilin ComGE [Streptococcus cameli]